jgi:cysteinyl-tRNA synthetase
LTEITLAAERRFDGAQQARDAAGMVRAILDVEAAIRAWASDTEEDQGTAQASEVLRTLVVRLGDAAVAGLRDPSEVVRPLVDPLIALRHTLRERRHFAVADELRSALTGAGLELHDTDDGTRWSYPAADPSSVRTNSGVAQ